MFVNLKGFLLFSALLAIIPKVAFALDNGEPYPRDTRDVGPGTLVTPSPVEDVPLQPSFDPELLFSITDIYSSSIRLPNVLSYVHRRFLPFVHYSLRCHKVWSIPSSRNDAIKCLRTALKTPSEWHIFVLPMLSMVIFVLLSLCYPCSCLCTLCCPAAFRPRTVQGRKASRCCIWLWIIYALLWAVLVLFLILSGAQLLIQSLPELIDDIESGPLHYFNSTAETLLDFTSDWSTGVRKPLHEKHVDITPFYRVQDQVRMKLQEARQLFFRHLGMMSMVSYSASSIGFVLVLLMIPFACLRCCIPFFPLIISIVYWIFGLIFSVLGALFIVLSIIFAAGCEEIELQYRRQPGVFQWYIVPYCQELFDFEQVHETVRTTESQLAVETCKKLLKACDNKPDPGITLPNSVTPKRELNAVANMANIPGGGSLPAGVNIPGVGGGVPNLPGNFPIPGGHPGIPPGGIPPGIDPSKLPGGVPANLPAHIPKGIPPEVLKNFDTKNLPGELKDLIKNGLSGGSVKPMKCGGNITDANQCEDFATLAHVLLSSEIKAFTTACPIKGKPCGVVECAFNCTVPFVTNVAREILDGALQARNATIALSYARPLLEWNFMIDKVAGALKRCNDFRGALLMMGGGFFVGGIMFLAAVYIAFRGSCIWTEQRMQKGRGQRK